MVRKVLSCIAALSLFGALLITVAIDHDECVKKQPSELAYKCSL